MHFSARLPACAWRVGVAWFLLCVCAAPLSLAVGGGEFEVLEAKTSLVGRGMHRELQTKVLARRRPAWIRASWLRRAVAAICLLSVEYKMPQQFFFDPEETYEDPSLVSASRRRRCGRGCFLKRTFLLDAASGAEGGAAVSVNIELPGTSPLLGPPPRVRQEALVFQRPLPLAERLWPSRPRRDRLLEWRLSLKLHARYAAPCRKCSGFRRAALPTPEVSLRCDGDALHSLRASREAREAGTEALLRSPEWLAAPWATDARGEVQGPASVDDEELKESAEAKTLPLDFLPWLLPVGDEEALPLALTAALGPALASLICIAYLISDK